MHKLLVVDDDTGNRTLAVEILMKEWPTSEILTAPNGRLGLMIAQLELPEIILLDWEMPEMNGLEMLTELRKDPLTQDIPVVMYTGIRTESNSLKQALQAGANEFLRKPVDPVELVARISSLHLQRKYFLEKTAFEQEKSKLQIETRERELQLQRNELTSLTLVLEQKDLFLKEIRQQLEAYLEDQPATEGRPALQTLLREISQELDSEKNWEAMKVRMNSMHAGFLSRLVEKHPDLTSNELKICTLMKLNLSGKEAANILHISVAGVEKRRYRLRKKLNLSGEIKLDNYIHSFSESS